MTNQTSRRQLMRMGSAMAAQAVASPVDGQEGSTSELPFVVCFEVQPTAGGYDNYLALAKELRPELDRIPGFLSIERSRSAGPERRLLSLSYWADEAALVAWRSHGGHHESQVVGRNELFADYRLRVAQVIRQCTPVRTETTSRRTPYNHPPHHRRQFLAIVQVDGPSTARERIQTELRSLASSSPALEFEAYESMANGDRTFFIANLRDEAFGNEVESRLTPPVEKNAPAAARLQFQICEVERDYGRFERAQAPQYFPPILKPAMGKEPRQ